MRLERAIKAATAVQPEEAGSISLISATYPTLVELQSLKTSLGVWKLMVTANSSMIPGDIK